ncbi:DUF6005 family protein [Paenibacillus oryzisoli]|uniref:Butirosin biosynthesis protein H N-terminal domain-containing protein n=1 Tax=Paenibacillus oryzisoli TaxID=1850517 RepID=A0A198A9H1_9BACL|nr:DUF6005 family protein [Paenibacillus oryzisoli]OAS17721.1 hypothetical protein A8708_14605 [Paenibacillus oryzisoli]
MKKFGQVHCLLDCYASILEEDGRLDFRPLYLGVWDAYFEVNENGIFYASESVDYKDWNSKFAMLYGNSCEHWYDRTVGKHENFSNLMNRMRGGNKEKVSIILVDLFYLPYSSQYRSKHTPHYVIVKQRKEQEWRINDPYFDWEGFISHQELWESFGYNESGEGLIIDTGHFQGADEQTIIQLFEKELKVLPGRLLKEVENFVRTTVERNGGYLPKSFFSSIHEVGVISKRYGGYYYVLQYLSERTGNEHTKTISTIKELIKGWESLMLTMTRYQILNKPVDLTLFAAKGDHLDKLELEVKKELIEVFSEWRSSTFTVTDEVLRS